MCINCLCMAGLLDCSLNFQLHTEEVRWLMSSMSHDNEFFLTELMENACVSQREGRVEVGIMTASTQATDERVQKLVSSRPSLDLSRECSYSPSISPLLFPKTSLRPFIPTVKMGTEGQHMAVINPLPSPLVKTTRKHVLSLASLFTQQNLSNCPFFRSFSHVGLIRG